MRESGWYARYLHPVSFFLSALDFGFQPPPTPLLLRRPSTSLSLLRCSPLFAACDVWFLLCCFLRMWLLLCVGRRLTCILSLFAL